MNPVLEIKNLEFVRDSFSLNIAGLTIDSAQTVVFVGPSGSGKSTFLDILCGINSQYSGEIKLRGQDLATVPLHQRRFGVVFQGYCLFPTMSIEENILFGYPPDLPAERKHERLKHLAHALGIVPLLKKSAQELSGGEKQRVAIARSLMSPYKFYLWDEPLNALDVNLRIEIRDFLRHFLRKEAATALIVTHDHEEALFFADQIVLFKSGKIVQQSTPWDIYQYPKSPYVISFFCETNQVSITLQAKTGDNKYIATIGEHQIRVKSFPQENLNALTLPANAIGYIRYDHLTIIDDESADTVPALNHIPASIMDYEFSGKLWIIHLKLIQNNSTHPIYLKVRVDLNHGHKLSSKGIKTVTVALSESFFSTAPLIES